MKRAFSFIRTKNTPVPTSYPDEVPAGEQHNNAVRRDPLYYNTPLILLVSHAVSLIGHNIQDVGLSIGGSGLVQGSS